MKHFLNKKGSFIVLVSLVFVSIIFFITFIIKISGDLAIKSSINSIGNLYAQNILAEYDIFLKERYGLFGVKLDNYLLEEKLNFYFTEALKDKSYIEFGDIRGEIDDYSLIDGNNFLEEINEINIFNVLPIVQNDDTKDEINHYIKAKWIINELPSYMDYKELDINILENVSIEEYLFIFFKDYVNKRDLGQTFFNNEIEYVISGKLNDSKAFNNVYNKLLLFRNTLNLAYLNNCPSKKEEALLIAELISPEFSLEVQAIILEIWAFMESKNDLALLLDKKEVPLNKEDDNWALSIENLLINENYTVEEIEEYENEIIENVDQNKNYVLPNTISGLDYDGYLKILLLEIPNEIKIYRMMDLIQINLKYIYNGSFLLKDYYTGLKYSINVNKREYNFKNEY